MCRLCFSFRRLAINLHPERDRDADPCNLDAENRRALFALVAEAYDVLSNSDFKSVYDEFGGKGLREGAIDSKTGKRIKPYVYHGEPLRTYREFFGTDNPYVDLLENFKVPYEDNTTVIPKRKAYPVIESLELTLEEVFFGGIKKKCYDEKMLSITIMPGLPTETRIVFPDFVDSGPSLKNADLIFVTRDAKHKTFKRDGKDLFMRVRITLKEALCGKTLTIDTIEGRVLRIPITSIASRPEDNPVRGHAVCRGSAQSRQSRARLRHRVPRDESEPGQPGLDRPCLGPGSRGEAGPEEGGQEVEPAPDGDGGQGVRAKGDLQADTEIRKMDGGRIEGG
ncbi:unnamed protein product [Trichogramma brassicae]|uniref:J domain-containing protein n=1 Tax=Trichogramma brassicae TaxID=86971 RepID=A0A6H5I229_9HYME|nr:unnamed protein product [Trichogramma brassicae]